MGYQDDKRQMLVDSVLKDMTRLQRSLGLEAEPEDEPPMVGIPAAFLKNVEPPAPAMMPVPDDLYMPGTGG